MRRRKGVREEGERMRERRTLSPHIVRLDHVRRENRNFVRARHVFDSRMTLKNLVSGMCDHPVQGSVQLDYGEGGDGGFG